MRGRELVLSRAVGPGRLTMFPCLAATPVHAEAALSGLLFLKEKEVRLGSENSGKSRKGRHIIEIHCVRI